MQTRYTYQTDRCGKMRFARAAAAKVAAKNKGELHDAEFKVYKCRRCLGYHLTTKK